MTYYDEDAHRDDCINMNIKLDMTTLVLLSSTAMAFGVQTEELIQTMIKYAADRTNRNKLEWIWYDHCHPRAMENFPNGHYVTDFDGYEFLGDMGELEEFFAQLGKRSKEEERPYFLPSYEAFCCFLNREFLTYHEVNDTYAPVLMPVELVHETEAHWDQCQWEYDGDDYLFLKMDGFKMKQRLYKRRNRYIRCIKCSMRNPQFCLNQGEEPVPFEIGKYRMELGYKDGEWTHLFVYVAMESDLDKERQKERMQTASDEDMYVLVDSVLRFGEKHRPATPRSDEDIRQRMKEAMERIRINEINKINQKYERIPD